LFFKVINNKSLLLIIPLSIYLTAMLTPKNPVNFPKNPPLGLEKRFLNPRWMSLLAI